MQAIPNLTKAVLAGAGLCLIAAGCERKTVVVVEQPPGQPVAATKTLETSALKRAIDDYAAAPTAENSADVRKALAELDGEIAELEGDVANKAGEDRAEAAQKLANLVAYRKAETDRFAKMQAGQPVHTPVDGRSGTQKVEDAARDTGEALKDAAKETGEALKDAARDTRDAIKDAVR